MIKIASRKKAAQITFLIICALSVALSVFLAVVAVMFSGSDGSPTLFGKNYYYVKTDAFKLIPAKSVVVGKKADVSTLGVGDIVIFSYRERVTKYKTVGEITDINNTQNTVNPAGNASPPTTETAEATAQTTENQQVQQAQQQAVKKLIVTDENGTEREIDQVDVLSKVVKKSGFMGVIVDFVSSPFGLLVIAVLPCILLVLSEVFKPLARKLFPPKVTPVNKQDEVPTFISVQNDGEVSDVEETAVNYGDDEAAKAEDFTDMFELDNPDKAVKPKQFRFSKPAAALKAYQNTVKTVTPPAEKQPLLFFSTETEKANNNNTVKPVNAAKATVSPNSGYQKPPKLTEVLQAASEELSVKTEKKPAKQSLSSVKLAEVIADVTDKRSVVDNEEVDAGKLDAKQKAERIKQIMAVYKPQKSNRQE